MTNLTPELMEQITKLDTEQDSQLKTIDDKVTAFMAQADSEREAVIKSFSDKRTSIFEQSQKTPPGLEVKELKLTK